METGNETAASVAPVPIPDLDLSKPAIWIEYLGRQFNANVEHFEHYVRIFDEPEYYKFSEEFQFHGVVVRSNHHVQAKRGLAAQSETGKF